MANIKEIEKKIKDLMKFAFKLNSENLLAVAVIYPSIRKSPPDKKTIEKIIKNRHKFGPEFTISEKMSFEMRKLDPLVDMGIDKTPGDFLAPMLAKQLKTADLRNCEAISYKEYDENLNAWEGIVFIGIVARL